MNREFKANTGIALLFTSLTLFGANASAVTFNVSNADEFQAALTTAGSNGGDDEIVLTPGTYGGNFKYTAGESAALTIRAGGEGEERAVLDGELRAYVLKIVPGCYRVDLSLERMDIINGKSEEADVLAEIRSEIIEKVIKPTFPEDSVVPVTLLKLPPAASP